MRRRVSRDEATGREVTGPGRALGRTLIAPAQIPAGLMMALVGAPYFLWLLRRTRG